MDGKKNIKILCLRMTIGEKGVIFSRDSYLVQKVVPQSFVCKVHHEGYDGWSATRRIKKSEIGIVRKTSILFPPIQLAVFCFDNDEATHSRKLIDETNKWLERFKTIADEGRKSLDKMISEAEARKKKKNG